MATEQQNALDIVKTFLARYGLGTLSDWAWTQIQQGSSPEAVQLLLYDRPEFKARFPAIEARRQKGLAPITPDEYVAYEQQREQIMRAAGFPPGFYDGHDDVTADLIADKSINELQQTAQLYQAAAYQAPVEVRNQLKTLYGIDEGHLAAYFADPSKALPILQQRFASATIAGHAERQSFGQLTLTEAERLAQEGVTDQKAAEGFAQVNQMHELFGALPGESETAPGRKEALGLVSGQADALTAVDQQARRRKAQFQRGGQYVQSQTGTTGLSSANT